MKRSRWMTVVLTLSAGAFIGQIIACTPEQASLTTAVTSTITAFGVLFLVDRVLRG